MDALAALKHYCPTGTAEGEKGILREIFVQPENFTRLAIPPASSPRLLVGRKGTGKSLLVDFALELMRKGSIPCAQVEPEDLKLHDIPNGASVAQITQHSFEILVLATAMALGEQLSGLLTGAEKDLYEETVRRGQRKVDSISRLAKILPKIAHAFVDFDVSQLLPTADRSGPANLNSGISGNSGFRAGPESVWR